MDRNSSRHYSGVQLPALPKGGNGKAEKVGPVAAPLALSNTLEVEISSRRQPTNGNNHSLRIVIADDHPIFRDGLRKVIESEPGCRVIGESSVNREVAKLARELKPDLLLLGLDQPQGSGLRVLSDLANFPSPVRTLLMTATIDEDAILEAFSRGAYGIVLKGSSRQVLLRSIRSVAAGQYWLDRESVPIVIEAIRRFAPHQNGSASSEKYGLTPRELDIVGRVANGASNKEVGQEFCICERTVKHHLTNIFEKVGVSTRLELAVFALEHGLVHKEMPGLATAPANR